MDKKYAVFGPNEIDAIAKVFQATKVMLKEDGYGPSSLIILAGLAVDGIAEHELMTQEQAIQTVGQLAAALERNRLNPDGPVQVVTHEMATSTGDKPS